MRKRNVVTEELLQRGAKVDRYEIRELIGHGGMGEVYRAWDVVLQRDVALKVLRLRDEDMLMRFEREAEAIGKLDSENVVQIHDFWLHGDHPYIVMEFLRGMSLLDCLSKGGPMNIEEAVSVTLGVCRGVVACHRLGIIHRDLKPANVFLAETAHYGTVVKILDFGVAKTVHDATDVTEPGQIAGTPAYIAPELLKGMTADELSDQYGIGLLLHVALTGKPPFGKKQRKELARAILQSDFVPLKQARPEITDELVAIVQRALSADRDARFESVRALGRALLPFGPAEERELPGSSFDDETRSRHLSQVTTVVQQVLPELLAASDGVPPRDRQPGGLVAQPHLMSTKVDLREPTWTHAGGVIDTGKKVFREGAKSKATVWILLGSAAVLAAAWVALFVRGPRVGEVRVELPANDAREGVERSAVLSAPDGGPAREIPESAGHAVEKLSAPDVGKVGDDVKGATVSPTRRHPRRSKRSAETTGVLWHDSGEGERTDIKGRPPW
jgi:serine/threonine protein kinase